MLDADAPQLGFVLLEFGDGFAAVHLKRASDSGREVAIQ
jgi:hypothetical protein